MIDAPRFSEPLRELRATGTCRGLLVDDVLTSGGSMLRARNAWQDRLVSEGKSGSIIGAVVFARGPCPYWVYPLFQLPKELWLPGTK